MLHPIARTVLLALCLIASDTLAAEHRLGFLEALGRRASFTRAHRGPLAAPIDGDPKDSINHPAAFHAGDRVLFAWHDAGKIHFAAFTPQGDVVTEPVELGAGQWPRIAADGKRAAVAWENGAASAVRVFDADRWSPEIPLDGSDPAIAFAPSGPLYAATTTGLWNLGMKFDRAKEGPFEQPALVVDSQGKPRLAHTRAGKIVVDDKELDPGERPSLTIGPDGALHLAYLQNGKLIVRSLVKESWSDPQSLPANNPAWPSLASGTDRPRVTFIAPATHGPPALYLLRLPSVAAPLDPESILMPSVAGNVTGAWLVLNFSLRDVRQKYRPHDCEVTINGAKVARFENTVPDGRYVFAVKPYHVLTSAGRPIKNHVGIRTRHQNGGHYIVSTDYTLITRTAWSERYAFAADARELANLHPGRINHDQPDLAVVANGLNLPLAPPPPGNIDLPVTVMNLGEAASKPAKLAIMDGSTSLAQADVPALDAAQSTQVTIALPHDGAREKVQLALIGQTDFDPANDKLDIMLWGRPRTAVAEAAAPAQPAAPSNQQVAVAAPTPRPLHLVRFLDAQSGKEAARIEDGTLKGPLPPGKYKLAVKRDPYEGAEVTFPRVHPYQSGEALRIDIKTTLELITPEWAGELYWWGAVDPQKPDNVIQWAHGRHKTILLPPGDYRLAIQPIAYRSQRLVFPDKITVKENDNTPVKADAGLSLPRFVTDRPKPYRWAVFPPDSDKPVQYLEDAWSPILVPPGEYRWGVHQLAYRSKLLILPEKINVKAGELATAKAPGLFEVKPEKWVDLSSFRLTNADAKTAVSLEGKPQPLFVPPGKYDLHIHPAQYQTREIPFARNITIDPDKTATVPIASGIDVQPAHEAPPLDQIDFISEGQDKPFQSWTARKWGPQPLPPGTYRIAILPQNYHSRRLTWPTPVTVEENQLAKLTFDSGVRITGPQGAKPDFTFQFLNQNQTLIQEGRNLFGVVWLPPGKYQLQVRAGDYDPWQRAEGLITVEPARITDHALKALPQPKR